MSRFWIALLIVVLCSCRSIALPVGVPVEDVGARAAVWRPASARILGRAVLTRGETQMDFTVLIKFDAARSTLQLVGLEDLGGTLLHGVFDEHGGRVERRALWIPEALVAAATSGLGAAMVEPLPALLQALSIDGERGLAYESPQQSVVLSNVGAQGLFERVFVGQNSRLSAGLTLERWRADADARYPEKLTIDVPGQNAQLAITVTEWRVVSE